MKVRGVPHSRILARVPGTPGQNSNPVPGWRNIRSFACAATGTAGVALACLIAGPAGLRADEEAQPAAEDAPAAEASPARIEATVTERLYLGVQVQALPEPLAAHLGRSDGLMVAEIVPDSPAAKAGVEVYDVLLQYNDTTLANVTDLSRVVNESGRGEGRLTLLRRGEQAKLTVNPEPMPQALAGDSPDRANPLGEMFWMGPAQVRPGGLGQAMGRARAGTQLRLNLPQGPVGRNLGISVQRTNDGPATIKITKDGESYEATEDNLDELPEDVREIAKRALSRGAMPEVRGFGERIDGAFEVPGAPAVGIPDLPGLDPDMQRAFDQMREEMRDNMRRMQEQMRQFEERNRAPADAAPKGVET